MGSLQADGLAGMGWAIHLDPHFSFGFFWLNKVKTVKAGCKVQICAFASLSYFDDTVRFIVDEDMGCRLAYHVLK